MPTASITGHIDGALVALYVFWAFFALLILYLRREDRREGYPLITDETDRGRRRRAFPPSKKVFVLPHVGATPEERRPERDLSGIAAAGGKFPGAPLIPLGNPMRDGLGPAAWAERKDEPDLTFDELLPKIVPLAKAEGFYLAAEDPDPRGAPVIAADGRVAGTVVDCWVDRSETLVRYLEVELPAAYGGRHVLVPTFLTVVEKRPRRVIVQSVTAAQFADAPGFAQADQVTLKEEDRIMAYFSGGHMYATADRLGPLL